MKPALKTLSVVAVLASAVLLSACSSAGDLASNGIPTSSSSREAGARGTDVCIQNKSSMNLRVLWQGYPDTRAIPPGGENCNSGYEVHETMSKRMDSNGQEIRDIAARLQYEPTAYPGSWLSWNLVADNTMFGSPWLALWYTSAQYSSGIFQAFSVDGEASMQTDWIAAKVKRIADTENNIEFVVTITDDIRGQNHAKNVTGSVKGFQIVG